MLTIGVLTHGKYGRRLLDTLAAHTIQGHLSRHTPKPTLPYLTSSTSLQLSKQTHNPNPISLKLNHLSYPHKPEHFALFASFAVYDFGHRKEREVRKDSLNYLVFDYNPIKLKIIPS